MGTRADFYIRKTQPDQSVTMEWLGSKAYDGYPDGIHKNILQATTEDYYREWVNAFLFENDDATFPDQGWPWPWDDSRTADYAYIFQDNKVMGSSFGYPLFDPLLDGDEDEVNEARKMDDYFPDMSAIKNVQIGGKRSGVILFKMN